MEKDRKLGQNGKDGMRRPRQVSREVYERNYQRWLDGSTKSNNNNNNKKEKE